MKIFRPGERPSWVVSLIPFVVLVAALALVIKVFGTGALDGGSQVALMFGAAVVVAISLIFYKIPWRVFEKSILDNITAVGTSILNCSTIRFDRIVFNYSTFLTKST